MDQERECTYDPLIELMRLFENVKAVDTSVDPFEGLSTEDALKKHIVDGIKKGLDDHLDTAMQTHPPLHIINEILLDGMKTVGELFGAGKMQLPFVLQSAEVMKAAVAHLEPHMEKVEGSEKGSILLATVAGDVHDIGKNLVDIILTNNGYRVVNIGIKQPINSILEKAQEHKCEVIGLSGLLVKSTLVMRDNLVEMNNRKVSSFPVILGGAALTRAYVEQDLREIYEGNVYYAQDAFEGLRLMGEIRTPSLTMARDDLSTGEDRRGQSQGGGNDERPHLDQELDEPIQRRVASHRTDVLDPALYVFDGTKSDTDEVEKIPNLPFYGAKRHTKFDNFELFKFINPIALWRGQWQYRKPEGMSNPDFAQWLEDNVRPVFEEKQKELVPLIKPAVKWGYFWCRSEGNDLVVLQDDQTTERTRFTFPRQRDMKRLCISDFFRPDLDVVGFHIVTIGAAISEYEREQFAAGDYQQYLYTHGMGVETAEALAEYWHKIVRQELGIDDQEPEDMRLLFSAKYHGARYSFGYPACPNLEDQRQLMELLQPADIGISLTEEFMLEPEQSTSAIIVHHPAARYFNVR
ncbi:MAG TPA: vitamin B12 dependent-methionine synthase activation domain-containing protein [Fimbriimonadaceae bacterium]|nr:vitamin B12 dependent-methionine synthase activation domain-containing protein [Fimbriimonadaceae bacterium]